MSFKYQKNNFRDFIWNFLLAVFYFLGEKSGVGTKMYESSVVVAKPRE